MGRWASPELVSAALTGDAEAVERLIAHVWPGCYRLAATAIGDAALAQDAAQEACAIVHRKIRSVRSAAAFDTWLYRVVMREASRVRRRFRERHEPPYDAGFAEDRTASLDVWRALAALPPHLRDVTILFYFDDLPTDEIAKILRIAHATVRTRLARSRQRLRSQLGEYDVYGSHQKREQHAF